MEHGRGSEMDNCWNLLFGVLAVQLKKVAPQTLSETGVAWAGDMSVDLPQRLVDGGAISKEDREAIAAAVEEELKAYGHNTMATLEALGGHEEVHDAFCGALRYSDTGEVRAGHVSGGEEEEEIRFVEEAPVPAEIAETLRDRLFLQVAVAGIAVVASLGIFLQVRAGRVRDELERDLSAARVEAEEARETLAETRKGLDQALNDAEMTKDALAKCRKTLTKAEKGREESERMLAQERAARRKLDEELDVLRGAPVPVDIQPPGPVELEPEPEPDKASAANRLPGLTKEEVAEALPKLIALLEMAETPDGGAAARVAADGDELPELVERLGFKDGDLITHVNRDAVESLKRLGRTLGALRDSSGFSVRTVRDGRSGWMRINVVAEAPPPGAKTEEEPDGEEEPEPEVDEVVDEVDEEG